MGSGVTVCEFGGLRAPIDEFAKNNIFGNFESK